MATEDPTSTFVQTWCQDKLEFSFSMYRSSLKYVETTRNETVDVMFSICTAMFGYSILQMMHSVGHHLFKQHTWLLYCRVYRRL